jgi:hypothetical protein
MKGAATVDTIELEDTTANLTCFYARRSVEDLFREMADARRNDRANAGEVHAASEGSEDEG